MEPETLLERLVGIPSKVMLRRSVYACVLAWVLVLVLLLAK